MHIRSCLFWVQNVGTPVPQRRAAKAAKASTVLPAQEASDEDAFAKAKLVVGLVKQVEEVSNSDKLYRCVIV